MRKFTIAHDYEDAAGKPLRLFVRFGRKDKVMHVGKQENATPFLSRQEAESFCPRGYHVEPKARVVKVKGARAKRKGVQGGNN